MRVVAVLALIAGLASVGGSSAAPDPWKPLYRPLQVPRIAAGEACPVSTVDPTVDFSAHGTAAGLGPGPAFPVGIADGTLELAPPRNFESRLWGGQKVLWFVHSSYTGPVLVRGRQLDGPNRVRFERGNVPPRELRIARGDSVHWTGKPAGSRGKPSFTRLRAAGCYAYQIDGKSFSRVIVFRADWLG